MKYHLPRQQDITKLLEIIKKKVLTGYHLPVNIRERREKQNICPHFKDVIAYIESGMLPSKKKAAKAVIARSENFIIIEGVLFKLDITSDRLDCKLTLCIPRIPTPMILDMFHTSLLACHQGTTRTYQTVRHHYYIPKLYEQSVAYLKACQVCSMMKGKTDKDR